MPNYKRTKRACYYAYLAMSPVFSLPPLLFMTFHDLYGISYTLLGTLLLLNFFTQLVIDLIFTGFSKHFNVQKTVRAMPLITSAGLLTFALVPYFLPKKAMLGLTVGTVIFSVAAGLNEVLISPLIAAIPSEHPDRDMSMLHSLYGWGVTMVVAVSSLYFKLFGTENWTFLTIGWAMLPIVASILFRVSPIPEIKLSSPDGEKGKGSRGKGIMLCAVCIFLGSCSENTMTGWISGFMEKALLIPKAVGDILGMAVFALLLTFVRMLYAKFGKNILKTMTVSMAGAIVCYAVAGCSSNVILGFLGCICTGICTSMLWPGTLILMEEKIPIPGVAAYALMAACGDVGAAVAPQLTGILVDKIAASALASEWSVRYGMTVDQVGLKMGIFCATVFPILGLIWLLVMNKAFKGKKKTADAAAE